MFAARIPVPWGAEPKAQVVYGLVKSGGFDQEEKQITRRLDFSELFPGIPDIIPSYKSPPTTVLQKSSAALERGIRDLLSWAVAKAIRKADAPLDPKSAVSALALDKAIWEPSTPFSWLRKQRRKPQPPKPKVPPARSKVSSVYQEIQRWKDLAPPSLLAWATEQGIKSEPAKPAKPLDPFATRSGVISLERRRQVATALLRGEWCLVAEIDVLPLRLKLWLIECNVRLIRYIGRRFVEGGGGAGTPVNGYVTETGTVFYVAEDGVTFYVQEN